MPIWQNVDPGLVTDGVSADTSLGVSRGDFHAGQNGAALICNGAADLSRGTLPSSKRTADHKYEPCTKKRIRYAFHFFLHKQHPGNFGDSIRGETDVAAGVPSLSRQKSSRHFRSTALRNICCKIVIVFMDLNSAGKWRS